MGHRHTKSKPSGVYQNQQPEKSNYQYNYNTGTYQRSPFRSDTASADKQVSERSQKTIQIKPTASIDTHNSMFDPHYKSFADQPSAPLTTDQDKDWESETETDYEPNDYKKLPTPLKHTEPVMTRINPKQAQQEAPVTPEKSPLKEIQAHSPIKEIKAQVHIPTLPIEKAQRLFTEENLTSKQEYQTPKGFVQIFDSARKYQSEYEQELSVKPEEFTSRDEFETSSEGLKIELQQWDMASNSSSAMTPRIIREQSRKDMPVVKEFEYSPPKTKLSPENLRRIQELTAQRKQQIQVLNDSKE